MSRCGEVAEVKSGARRGGQKRRRMGSRHGRVEGGGGGAFNNALVAFSAQLHSTWATFASCLGL